MFAGMPIEWVTLDELSHGAAFMMSQNPTTRTYRDYSDAFRNTRYSVGIMLANEKVVTIVSKGTFMPTRDKLMFTNSEDDQTTATVQLFEDNEYFEELTLEGLTPRPKGQARIKVELVIEHNSDILVTIQELGTNLKAHRRLGLVYYSDTLFPHSDEDEPHDNSIERIEMTFGEDGVIGELPE
ncbi:hypothetical protein CPB86DRAFT_270570 [Serendipita vermifera]|nr:hypothetical protein CPB86DRAFT_270570 [Serendipita vermifera]